MINNNGYTFLVTYYAHNDLLYCCLDSIRKFYPNSRIVISQQDGDEPIDSIINFDLIYHDMKNGVWADVAIGLLKECNTKVAIFMEHDVLLTKDIDNYIEMVNNNEYDVIGPEDVVPYLNRNYKDMVCQNFMIVNVEKLKELGLDSVRSTIGGESGHGISQVFNKKLFLPITKSGYAYGTYYGSEIMHLWYGSYRARPVFATDNVNPKWMELESSALIDDYLNGSFRTTINEETIKLPVSNKRKYAVLLCAHKEKEMIGASIKQWKGLVDKVLVLYSMVSWNGNSIGDDGTIAIANELADEVILGEWKSEAEQRSWGLARLWDYDYVINIDPDEFFTLEDRKKIISELDRPIHMEYTQDFGGHRQVPAFKTGEILTYWKTTYYVLDPPDKHKPIIVVDPKQIYCYEHRNYKYSYSEHAIVDYVPKIDVTMHHMSWVKSDEKVKEKIGSFSHAKDVKDDWYDRMWLKSPLEDIEYSKPYGEEKFRIINKKTPQEISDILIS